MDKVDTTGGTSTLPLNIEFMRSLVKQYSELGQWSSALFWADMSAGAGASRGGGGAGGDDVWLLASSLLAQGELHRAAHAVTSRQLHKNHLLCLGVAMRAFVSVREPAAALALIDECDATLMEPRANDHTHNRALAGVLVWQAKALSALERRDAAAEALSGALRADGACVEALSLLLEQRVLTTTQESELVESLPLSSQMSPAEAMLVRAAYRDRLRADSATTPDTQQPLPTELECARNNTAECTMSRARRLVTQCKWQEALKALDSIDGWCLPEVRVACLVELRRSAELFAFAHQLVDSYPHTWQAWYAVGCYYYLIRKSEFARRYLSKAKSVSSSAGCIWLAYGHCFALEGEHDQAIAAYFKRIEAIVTWLAKSLSSRTGCIWLSHGHCLALEASQLMAGCYLPPLYVAVEHALLNNFPTCERFMLRAANIHQPHKEQSADATDECDENSSGWDALSRAVSSPHIAHEAGCAALAAGHPAAAVKLWLHAINSQPPELDSCWAATLEALGHACRRLGQPAEALHWHQQALALRPGRADTYAAMGLCLALLGRSLEAAHALHTALAKSPDDVVAQALLDAVMDRVDDELNNEEIPQFPFPAVLIPPPSTPTLTAGGADQTHTSDMSMSFD